MSVMNFFVCTAAEADTARGFNSPSSDYQIDPRAIDNASPGVGINLNPSAAHYASGEAVTLTGASVAPKRIVDDPHYAQSLKDFLLTLPWASLETETIFAPVE